MTEEQFLELVCKKKARDVVEILAATPLADRRRHAKVAAQLFRDTVMQWAAPPDAPKVRDRDAPSVAVLATASLGELKKLGFQPLPQKLGVEEVVRALSPEWVDDWVEAAIEQSPHLVSRFAPLWQAGLCKRPAGEAFILGYYAHFGRDLEGAGEASFLEEDVWRFFEVEGGGEFSLASHDKYAGGPDFTWSTRLLKYVAAGRLDRARLLDVSLDALQRDFGQFRAGWYSRFHAALEPTVDEMTPRADRYLALLASSVPPTVSLAMKCLQTLDKAGAVAPGALLEALEAPLQARQKSTVTAALKMAGSAARRDPALKARAASMVTRALVAEAADVQSKALDLIEKLGGAEDASVRSELAQYVDLAAPSVRDRLASLVGASAGAPQTEPDQVTGPREVTPVLPVATAEDALALFLAVLESPRDPLMVERAIDGVARFGAELRGDEKALSPLRKRAGQIWKAQGESRIRFILAATGRALAEGKTFAQLRREVSDKPTYQLEAAGKLSRVFLDRNDEVIANVLQDRSLPMLSTPSDDAGCIAPSDLVARMEVYRERGIDPGKIDLALGLLRLSAEGRPEALKEFAPVSEAERALAYALGADVTPGDIGVLWSAAWAARQPTDPDERIAALFTPHLPDCGTPADPELKIWKKEQDVYHWIVIEVPVSVAETASVDQAIPAMFFPIERDTYFYRDVCGHVFEDIAWSSLVRPNWSEPFHRQALLHMDTSQKLSDHFCLAFLEPFFRAGPAVQPLGAATLAYYIASEDKSVSTLAGEAVVSLLEEERLDAASFASAVRPFLMSAALPTARWTKGFAAIAATGPVGAAFVRQLVTLFLDFPPDETPRDMGGMLELLYELHVAAGAKLQNADALACLKAMTGGGKLAKFAAKLVQMSDAG